MTGTIKPWSDRQIAIMDRLWRTGEMVPVILAQINRLEPGETPKSSDTAYKFARKRGYRRDPQAIVAQQKHAFAAANAARFGRVSATGEWPDDVRFEDADIPAHDGARVRLIRPATHVPGASSAHTMAGV